MKPLNKNLKKPRGSAVDSERDRTRTNTLKMATEADIKLSIIAEDLFKINEPELATTARKIRREIGDLERRIKNMIVVRPKEDQS